jgi:RecA-family ATPase
LLPPARGFGVGLFIYGKDYLALPRAPETWLVQGILPAGGLLNIYGPPKEGKTYAALGLALALTGGASSWLEWEIPSTSHGPVAYLQLDMPRAAFITETLEHRLIRNNHDISGIAFADQNLDHFPAPFNILGDGYGWLKNAVQQLQPKAVIVDTLRDAHGADENDSGIMRNVVAAFRTATTIDEVNSPALVFISHSKKTQGDLQVDLMAGNRGSNFVAGKMDTVMRVQDGSIQVKGRNQKLMTLDAEYGRDPDSWLWRKVDVKAEQRRDLQSYVLSAFESANARNKAFAERWGIATSTAADWFKLGHPSERK